MIKHKLLIYCLLYFTLYSCSPKLKITEIEQIVNENNRASFEGNIEYLLKNMPKKYLKEFSEKAVREKLIKKYKNRDYPVAFSQIGELVVKDRNRCNSSYYYEIRYKVTTSRMTPYLDSTALKLNQNNYGKENVTFNPNSKILHITKEKPKFLIFDNDKNWKLLDIDKESLNKYYGKEFLECTQLSNEVNGSD